jgi:hypothetical protein
MEFGSGLTKSVTKFGSRRGGAAAFGARQTSSAPRSFVRQKQMRPVGLKAFAAQIHNKSGIYSYEQRSTDLKQPYAKLLKKNKAAWNFFEI